MSRFVSGGTNEEPTERDSAWITAQAEIEARKAEKAAQAQQNDGKSLYETLQANKAAKQDAFEESIKLRNQFQSLDEDDVEFLDSVLESTRAAEAAVKRQTREQLELFKRQQEEAEQKARSVEEPEAEVKTESWTVSRKRKKGREDVMGKVKLRKGSSGVKTTQMDESDPAVQEKAGEASVSPGKTAEPVPKTASTQTAATADEETQDVKEAPKTSISPSPGGLLGLGAYSSDEDD